MEGGWRLGRGNVRFMCFLLILMVAKRISFNLEGRVRNVDAIVCFVSLFLFSLTSVF
jgi:hypothetical protein